MHRRAVINIFCCNCKFYNSPRSIAQRNIHCNLLFSTFNRYRSRLYSVFAPSQFITYFLKAASRICSSLIHRVAIRVNFHAISKVNCCTASLYRSLVKHRSNTFSIECDRSAVSFYAIFVRCICGDGMPSVCKLACNSGIEHAKT